MKASRTDASRMIPFHDQRLAFDGAAALRRRICALIQRRVSAPSTRDLEKWFCATDPAFLSEQITALVVAGTIRACSRVMGRKRHNAATYYELTD